MSFRIYTKTGDEGKTSLIGGTRVSKSDIRIEAYGTIDELNSTIGMVRDQVSDLASTDMLKEIQDRLFTIGSILATDPDKNVKMQLPDLHEEDIVLLENEIDRMDDALPALKSFILPGGHLASSTAHVARCVCRRAERICVHMQDNQQHVDSIVIKYINRLSDYLFTLARYICHLANVADIEWHPRTEKK
jgi:cob(I)alamin adenosyltransferase